LLPNYIAVAFSNSGSIIANAKYHVKENIRWLALVMVRTITIATAQTIADKILSSCGEGIQAVTLIEIRKANTLVFKAKGSFEEAVSEAFKEGPKYFGPLVIAYLSIANEVREIVGQTKCIITIFEKYKTMILPLPTYGIVVGVALELWVDVEDGKLANNIEKLAADNASVGAYGKTKRREIK